jgi:hypothetical protein
VNLTVVKFSKLSIYEAYPQNKFRLQILPLQPCGHYDAHFGRNEHNLQTTEPRLRIVLCVQNVQENREARRI